jgi:hypothetical protein
MSNPSPILVASVPAIS